MAGTPGASHDKLASRRVKILAGHLADLIPPRARVLDVGCGDGMIDSLISRLSPEISVQGIDVTLPPHAQIPVRPFDGIHIPYPDNSFDVVIFVDVLHQTDDPLLSLQEARRVAKTVLIKDYVEQGLMAGATLRLMDRMGNPNHRVVVPYNYWPKAQWDAAFDAVGLKQVERMTSLGLYPPPASWIFERGLHFIARLERDEPA